MRLDRVDTRVEYMTCPGTRNTRRRPVRLWANTWRFHGLAVAKLQNGQAQSSLFPQSAPLSLGAVPSSRAASPDSESVVVAKLLLKTVTGPCNWTGLSPGENGNFQSNAAAAAAPAAIADTQGPSQEALHVKIGTRVHQARDQHRKVHRNTNERTL